MSYNAGNAYISIRPDFSDFSDDIKAEMAEQGDRAGQAFADAFKAEVEESLAGLDTDVAAGADTSELDAQLDEATRDRTATITLDDSELASQIAEADAALDDAAKDRTARFIVDSSGVAEDAAAIDAALDDAAKDRTAKISLDDSELAAEAAVDDGVLDDVAKERTSKVDLDDSDAAAKLDDIVQKLNGLNSTTVKPEVDETALDKIPLLVTAIGAGIVTLGPEAAGAAVGLSLLGGAFGAAALDAGGLSNAEEILESKLQDGANSVQGFGSTLASVGGASLHDFEGAASDAGAALGTLFVAFAPEIEAVAKDVEGLAADFENWAKSVNASGIEDWLSKTFNSQTMSELKTDLGDAVNIIENIGKAVELLSPVALGDLTAALDVLRLIPPDVIAGLIALFAAWKLVNAGPVQKAISAIADLFGSSGDGEAGAAGKEIGDDFATGVDEGAKTAAEGVDEIIGGMGDGAAGEANAAGDAVGGAFAAGVGEGAAGIGAAIGGEVGGIGLAALAGAFAAGALLGAAVGAGFVSGLGVTGASGKLESDIKNAASGAGSWLEEAGDDAAKGFADGFESGMSAISSDADKIKSDLTSALSGSTLETQGEQAAKDFMDGLEKGFGEGLADIGKNVVLGLIEGIESEVSDLIQEASSIASDIVHTIESVLGISSPAKATIELGEYGGEGLGIGFLNMKPFVADAAGQLAHVSLDELSRIGAPQSLGALSGMAAAQSLGSLAAVGAGQSLPGVSGPLGTGAMQMQVSYAGADDELANAVVKSLRFSIQGATGGDVQAHLGKGTVRIPR